MIDRQFIDAAAVKKENMYELADELIKHIINRKDLFKETKVVFPSSALAQYFKMYWLKNKSEVLMNVDYLTIDECLLECIDTDKSYFQTTSSQIRDHIIKYLITTDKNNLDKQITNYIYDDQKINDIRLFDFANSLTILFRNYEIKCFEFNGWEKELYQEIMEELFNERVTTFSYLYNKVKKIKDLDEDLIFFGFNSIPKLYEEPLLELLKNKNAKLYLLDDQKPSLGFEKNIKLYSAPSKSREIELVHSKICSLVNEGTSYSDIVVLAPDISKYQLEIQKVFNQDGENFPNIPYAINCKNKDDSDVSNALKKFHEIITKGFFTRNDFSQLINNKVIQDARNISLVDVDAFENAIIDMNVFRNGKNIDDWKYAKYRLLLSKVVNTSQQDSNIIELKEGTYIPFSKIDLDDDNVIKFINVIDDLNELIHIFKGNTTIDETNINILKDNLSRWFNNDNFNNNALNKSYLEVLKELNYYEKNLLGNIPCNILFYSLIKDSEVISKISSQLFINGITFADYDEDVVLPSKTLFFIGLSSKEFPVINIKSELDYSPDIDIEKELYPNFLNQCYGTENLYLSYVNIDLKTEEVFYPSSFVVSLFKQHKLDLNAEIKINIDEDRKWDELYTKSAYRNKDYYLGLFTNEETQQISNAVPQIENQILTTVSKLKSFLEEPLKFKFAQLCGETDDKDNEIKSEYEPLSINALISYNIVNEVLTYMLENPTIKFIDSNDDVDIDYVKKTFARMIINHQIPYLNDECLDSSLKSIVKNCVDIKGKIEKFISTSGYSYPDLVQYNDTSFNVLDSEIIVTHNFKVCRSINNDTFVYFDLSQYKKNVKEKDYLRTYVCSLIEISQLNTDTSYNVVLWVSDKTRTYSVTPNKAKETLINILKNMFSYEHNFFMDISSLSKDSISSLSDAIEVVADKMNGPWKYFVDSSIFNLQKDLGYNDPNFSVNEMKRIMKDLILFLEREA